MTRTSRLQVGSSSFVLAASLALFTACPPTYPKCESDENCKEKGEVCVQGMCQECAKDENCKPGFVCEANRCVPKPECTPSGGCGPNQKCTNGKCEAAQATPVCAVDEDCPSGQGCTKGACVARPAVETTCTFEPVRFGFNEYTLEASAQTALGTYAECIKKGGLRVTLEGFADERGTFEYNMQLSQKRAASVRKYLVDLGVTGGALDTVGFGEERPARPESTEEAWAANRRVEFKKR